MRIITNFEALDISEESIEALRGDSGRSLRQGGGQDLGVSGTE